MIQHNRIVTRLMAVFIGTIGLASCKKKLATSDELQGLTQGTRAESSLFLPIADWTGRLILPKPNERRVDGAVFIEVQNAPASHKQFVGRTVRLSFSKKPELQNSLEEVTRDVAFSKEIVEFEKKGAMVATRINGWKRVGPLESFAAAHPQDDITVELISPAPLGNEELVIEKPPVQISGSLRALVRFAGQTPDSPRGESGPQVHKVRHYKHSITGDEFLGAEGTLYVPKIAWNAAGRKQPPFTMTDIEKSHLNAKGWYVYGHKDLSGKFILEAIEPRALMQLIPNQDVIGKKQGLDYIINGTWKDTPKLKGTASTTAIFADARKPISEVFRPGEKYILTHLFGGIGGKRGEPYNELGIMTGHFSFGFAEVIKDPFTGEHRFDVVYKQVYGQGTDGVLSASMRWHQYMGNLANGWMWTRPVGDFIVSLPWLNKQFQIGGETFNVFERIDHELENMMARYRVGEGEGAIIWGPVRSCSQDSSQALFLAIDRMHLRLKRNPKLQSLFDSNETRRYVAPANSDPEHARFQNVLNLSNRINQVLFPMKIIRPDWNSNRAVNASNFDPNYEFVAPKDLVTKVASVIVSNNSLIPKRVSDKYLEALLEYDANMWIMRTNQIGGTWDETVFPLAPIAVLPH